MEDVESIVRAEPDLVERNASTEWPEHRSMRIADRHVDDRHIRKLGATAANAIVEIGGGCIVHDRDASQRVASMKLARAGDVRPKHDQPPCSFDNDLFSLDREGRRQRHPKTKHVI
jgi:hypothetical protein